MPFAVCRNRSNQQRFNTPPIRAESKPRWKVKKEEKRAELEEEESTKQKRRHTTTRQKNKKKPARRRSRRIKRKKREKNANKSECQIDLQQLPMRPLRICESLISERDPKWPRRPLWMHSTRQCRDRKELLRLGVVFGTPVTADQTRFESKAAPINRNGPFPEGDSVASSTPLYRRHLPTATRCDDDPRMHKKAPRNVLSTVELHRYQIAWDSHRRLAAQH
jgi:hypothetical protein